MTSGTTGSPSGSVVVQNGGDPVCTIALHPAGSNTADGTCPALSRTQLPPGSEALTANYPGDGNFQSSVSSARPLTIVDHATQGYWEVGSDGGIFTFGTARFYGSMGGTPLNSPIVGIASTPDGGGYWLVAKDGGVFAFGDARFHGSMGGIPLNEPIVGIASTADGGGYWLVAKDGGVFAFGDARFYGSMGGIPLNQPIVGIAGDPTTGGYWEVASDGGIFAFDAPFLGSAGSLDLAAPVVGIASLRSGGGYWEVAADGGLLPEGDAPFLGSMGAQQLNEPVQGIAGTLDGGGYRMVASDGGIFSFGDAEFDGSMGGAPLAAPIVGIADARSSATRSLSPDPYPTTVTSRTRGAPGTGVHGVGLQRSGPGTNGTSTEADPGRFALKVAVKLVPEAALDTRASTRRSEIVGGPGQLPPDMSLPPVITMVEPTVTQVGVAWPPGRACTAIVPLEHTGPVGAGCAVTGGASVVTA